MGTIPLPQFGPEIWQPGSPFLAPVAQEYVQQASSLAEQAQDLAGTLRGVGTGLVLPEYRGQLSADWIDSPGSPAFYVSHAAGFLTTAAEGGVCSNAVPWSTYHSVPAPPGMWCCDHDYRHCR